MRLQWLIKKSRYAKASIYSLIVLPFISSLLLNLPAEIQLAVLLISIILSGALLSNINFALSDEDNYLSWQNGTWTFCTKELIIKGKQRKQSFSLGILLFLSIEDPLGNHSFLWLFPDSTSDEKEDYHKNWRQLHGCFNLSNAN